jgi:hypothetical protein
LPLGAGSLTSKRRAGFSLRVWYLQGLNPSG